MQWKMKRLTKETSRKKTMRSSKNGEGKGPVTPPGLGGRIAISSFWGHSDLFSVGLGIV